VCGGRRSAFLQRELLCKTGITAPGRLVGLSGGGGLIIGAEGVSGRFNAHAVSCLAILFITQLVASKAEAVPPFHLHVYVPMSFIGEVLDHAMFTFDAVSRPQARFFLFRAKGTPSLPLLPGGGD